MLLEKKIIYFLTVVDEGSFSAASRKLYISPAAVSQYISILENEISIQLFDRSGYKPILTDIGKFFYDSCKKIYLECKQLENEIKTISSDNVSIGFTRSHNNRHFFRFINIFKTKYPLIDVSFIEGSFEDTAKNLIEGKIDVSFGLESDFKPYKEIEYEILHEYNLCVICSYKNSLALLDKVTVEDIKNKRFIILSKSFGKGYYCDLMKAFKKDGMNPKIKKEVNSFDEYIYSIVADEGIGIVSSEVIKDTDIKVLPLINSYHHSCFAVGFKKEHKRSVQNIIDESLLYFKTL